MSVLKTFLEISNKFAFMSPIPTPFFEFKKSKNKLLLNSFELPEKILSSLF